MAKNPEVSSKWKLLRLAYGRVARTGGKLSEGVERRTG